MKSKSQKVNSPFVVDQQGRSRFLYGLVLASLLGFGFRQYFSEQRVSQELRLAFSRLEPELKLQFVGARLSLDEGWFWPQVGIVISDLKGSYQISPQIKEPIDLQIDEVIAPIDFWALIGGHLKLKVLELGHLSIRIPSATWTQLRNQTLPMSSLPTVVVPVLPTSFKDSKIPRYEPSIPKPVNQVRIKSLRLLSEENIDWPFEFRQIKFDLDSKDRAEIASQLFFPYQHWGSLPSLPLFFRWNPEDRFISVNLSGRFREGHLRLSGTFDFAQDFFNFEFLGRTLPVNEIQIFLQKWSQSQFFKNFWTDFPLRYWLEAEWPGWLNLEVSSLGYLSQDKSSQVILRHVLLEEGDQNWELETLTGTHIKDKWSWSDWQLQAQSLTFERAKAWLPLPKAVSLIKQGIWQAKLNCKSYVDCLGSYNIERAQLGFGSEVLLNIPNLIIEHQDPAKFEFNAVSVEIENWMQQKVKLSDWSWVYQPLVTSSMHAKQVNSFYFKGIDFIGLDFNLESQKLIDKATFSQAEFLAESQVPNESQIWPLKVAKVLWQATPSGLLKLDLVWPNNKKMIYRGMKTTKRHQFMGGWEDGKKNKKLPPSQTILNW